MLRLPDDSIRYLKEIFETCFYWDRISSENKKEKQSPSKYNGNANEIITRSQWELKKTQCAKSGKIQVTSFNCICTWLVNDVARTFWTNHRARWRRNWRLLYIKLPIVSAVSRASPVSILTCTPLSNSVCTASRTPGLGGSNRPMIPRNDSCCKSVPIARAMTENKHVDKSINKN